MSENGATFFGIVLLVAALLAAIVLFFAGQLWLSIPFAIFGAIVAAAALFNRAKPPTA